MMMNKQKSEKKSFKGTILKIVLVFFAVFMIFGMAKSCVSVKADGYESVSQLYNTTSEDYFFISNGFYNCQSNTVYLPTDLNDLKLYKDGSAVTGNFTVSNHHYYEYTYDITLTRSGSPITQDGYTLYAFTISISDFEAFEEWGNFNEQFGDTPHYGWFVAFNKPCYANWYVEPEPEPEPEPSPGPGPDSGISSLNVNNYYYFDTDLTEFARGLGLTNGSYATISTSNNIVFGQYLDIAFTSIRFGRFFPESSFSEFYLELYNSNNSTSIRLWSCVYDYSGTEPVLSYSHWYVDNPTLYILNNQVTYTIITESGFFSILNHGSYDEYFSIYNNAWQSGYNAGITANNNTTYSSAYNEGYDDGFVRGKEIGLSDTSNPLIDNAYDSGFSEGKALGRQEALLEDNDYTFRGLMFAVLQAPITVFSGLFNWYFLGYNLKDFFFTCLTIACIIAIVRRFI